jgi:hypothetical protein
MKIVLSMTSILTRHLKILSTLFIIILLCFSILQEVEAQTFIHPGLFSNQQELDTIKARVLAKKEPWLSAYNNLVNTSPSLLFYKPNALKFVSYAKPSTYASLDAMVEDASCA